MSLQANKWLQADAVDGSKFKLANAQTLRARNAANTADVALFSLTAADKLVFNIQPEFANDPTLANHLVRKGWVDTQLGLYLLASEKGAANGVATLDAAQLIPITQLPPAALERLVIVADQAARFALTTATVQNGDTVKQTSDGKMFFVKDDTQLGSAAGYEEYTAGTASSVAWSGITGTPTTLAGYGITDAVKSADLSSTANGKGASLVGVEDAAGKFTGSDLETILLELANKTQLVGREVITLVAGDITNGYVDLAHLAIANSLQVTPKGGLLQEPGVDFTESNVASKTRITFAGDLTLLAAGDKLICYYLY